MTGEDLKTELAQAEEAELHSADQLRRMLLLLDGAMTSQGVKTPSDVARLAAAALSLNERLAVLKKAAASAVTNHRLRTEREAA